MDIKALFTKQIQKNYTDFQHKIEQSKLFQLQEKLSENIITEFIAQYNHIVSYPKIEVYQNNERELKNMGKTYKNVFEEKLFTDTYRVFEEYLKDIFTSIFTTFPYLLIDDKKKEIEVPFHLIFANSPDLEDYKNLIIAERVKVYMQGDNILKILERFKSTFYLTLNLQEQTKIECQRLALLRNIITHNNSKINEIYMDSIQKFAIPNNLYKLHDTILPYLENEINQSRSILTQVVSNLNADLSTENNFKTLQGTNNTKSNI